MRLAKVGLRQAAIATTLLAFVLRVIHLGNQSLWYNETYTVYVARRGPQYIVQHLVADHVPLHYLLLYGWAGVAGWSEFAVRFLSVLAGVLTVPLLYRLLHRMGLRWLAVSGALALAISPFHVYYSQEGRMHILACLFVTMAAYCLLEAWRRDSVGRWLMYGIAAAAALYTFYYSALALAGLNIPLLFRHNKRRGWWLANACAVLAVLPWVVLVYGRFSRFIGHRIGFSEAMSAGDLLLSSTHLAFGSTLDGPLAVVPGFLLGVLALGCCLLVARSGHLLALALAASALASVFGLYFINLLAPVYDPRYFLVALPAWIAVVVIGLSRLRRRHRLLLAGMGTLLFVGPGSVALFNNYFVGAYQRPNYRQTFATIRAQALPGDAVVYDTPFQPWAVDYYFADQPLPTVGLPEIRDLHGNEPDLAELTGTSDWPATDLKLAELSRSYGGIWLVLFGQPDVDPTNRVERWLDEHRVPVSDRWIDQVRLKHYLPAAQPASQASLSGGSRIDAAFGPLHLLSIRTSQLVSPGRLVVDLIWTMAFQARESYRVSLQLFDSSGQRLAQRDGPPLSDQFPTSAWHPGLAYTGRLGLDLLHPLPPGLYQLKVSVYDTHGEQIGAQRTVAQLANLAATIEARPNATTHAGWTLSSVRVARGLLDDTFVGLDSMAILAPEKAYTWFVHLLDAKGTLIAQDDHAPLVSTALWRPGDHMLDWFSLPAATNQAAELEIGAYDSTGRRVLFVLPGGSTTDHLRVNLAD